MLNTNPRRMSCWSLLLCLLSAPALWAQTRPIAIVGGTLIDGTGGAAVDDSVVIFQNGRVQDVGKRGAVAIPRGAEVIEAKGKTVSEIGVRELFS